MNLLKQVLCMGLVSVAVNSSQARVIERIVAIVNNEIITLSDLESYREKLKKGGLVDDALLKVRDVNSLLSNRQSLVNHMIDERILDSEVKRKDLSVTIEKVEQEIRDIARKNNISRNQLRDLLKDQGVNFSDYQDFVKKSIERRQLIEREVTSKIKISDDDVNSYFAKNSEGETHVYEFNVSHILFLRKNGGEAEAIKRAEAVLKKLQEGLDFSKAASQFSEDPNFTQGGHLGKFKQGEMLKSFEQAISPLQEGQHSEIVSSRAGIHILKVTKKTLIVDPALDNERDRIRNMLFAEAFKTHFRNWIEQRRQESFIRIN